MPRAHRRIYGVRTSTIVFLVLLVLHYDVISGQSRAPCPVRAPCFCEDSKWPASVGTQGAHYRRAYTRVICSPDMYNDVHGQRTFPRFTPMGGTILSLSMIYTELRNIPHDAFSGLKPLAIDLRGNNFTSRIHPRAFLSVAKKLHALDLSWSNVTSLSNKVFRGMQLLQNLSLAENHISRLHSGIFQDLCRLRRLTLAGNPIHDLPVDIFRYQTNLEFLDLGYCQLRRLTWGLLFGLWNLRHLDLRGNKLHTLGMQAFMDLYNLQTLQLTHNPVRRLRSRVFVGLQHLRVLQLEEGSLEHIDWDVFHDTKHLVELDLSDNRLSHLSFGTLFIPGLEFLALDGNRIEVLPRDIKYLKNLKHLDVSYNKLTAVDRCLLEALKNLEYLNLRENPFNCDCDTIWLRRIKRDLIQKWHDRRKPLPFLAGKCSEPQTLRGIEITSWLDLDCLKLFYHKPPPDCNYWY